MKTKLNLFILGIAFLFAGCEVTTDYIFDDISTHRLSQYIEECNETLLKAPNGWKLVYYPDTSQYGAYTFLMKFKKGYKVEMQWDVDGEVTEGSYDFNSAQGPLLCFTTYSLLHKLADPDPNVLGGAVGMGFKGEFEFMIRGVTDNRIDFMERKDKFEFSMVRATENDWSDLDDNRRMINLFEVDRDAPFYQYLEVDGELAFFSYSQKLRMAYLAYSNGYKTISHRLPWASGPDRIRFIEPVTFNGLTFQEVTIDNLGKLSIPEMEERANFFRETDYFETCRLRFPGAVELSMWYPGYNLVERGRALDFLTPPGHGIEYYRFYWNLVGYIGAELYIRNERGVAIYAGLYTHKIVEDEVGDQVTFEKHRSTNVSGAVDNNTYIWFGMLGGYFPGPLTTYYATKKGFTIIPFGTQFYMIRNDNNQEWCLYSRKEMVE